MPSDPKIRDHCPSCGESWRNHLGIVGVCKELQDVRSALRELRDAAEPFANPGHWMKPDELDRVAVLANEIDKAAELLNDRS